MKVAICTPCHSTMHPQFVLCLTALLQHTAKMKPAVEVTFGTISTSVLPLSRCELLKGARQWGADYILWIDADQTFPRNALTRLLSLKRDVVGANILTRERPRRPTALELNGDRADPIWTTEEKARARLVEPVYRIGTGLLLTKVSVFDKLPWPPFMLDVKPDGQIVGEDTYFCRLLREAGIAMHVDHLLSWDVGHIGAETITFAGEAAFASSVLPAAGRQ